MRRKIANLLLVAAALLSPGGACCGPAATAGGHAPTHLAQRSSGVEKDGGDRTGYTLSCSPIQNSHPRLFLRPDLSELYKGQYTIDDHFSAIIAFLTTDGQDHQFLGGTLFDGRGLIVKRESLHVPRDASARPEWFFLASEWSCFLYQTYQPRSAR